MTLNSRFNWRELREFCSRVFIEAGVAKENAETLADSLVYADLRGVHSHGVVRTEIYLERISRSMINPNAEIRIERENDGVALVDGNNNLGSVVGMKALDIALEKAKSKGFSLVGVKNSNHFGTCAYYISEALKEDIILIAMTNASQTMAPFGGVRPFIGTNPFGIGFPTQNHTPFILDMAPSVVAKGKIFVAAKKGEKIPLGWAVDKHGQPTTDPQEAIDGSVVPIGGPKGYGISLFVDILCGVLTGAGFGKYINSMYDNWSEPQNVGHFFIAIDIKSFMPVDEFKQRLDLYISELKSEPAAENIDEILIPGELEKRREEDQKTNGIELPEGIIEGLKKVGRQYNVSFPQGI